MCVYCSKLKENDLKRIYVQINTYIYKVIEFLGVLFVNNRKEWVVF